MVGRWFCQEGTEEAFQAAVQAHLKHGATSIIPTLSASSADEIRKAGAVCEAMMAQQGPVQGLHLEGPYLNRKMAGALFADHVKDLDKEEYRALLEDIKCIKRWDISPELEGAMDFAQYVKSKGIMLAVTHTEAEYDLIKAANEAGFTHAAHFYNAMPGFHKRREYKYEGTVERILRLVYKLKGVEKTCLVTDAVSYAACEHPQVDPRFVIEDGVCKLADHSSLAGSLATMDDLVRTMVQKADIPLADAIRMASETPARLIGIDDRKGTLARGKDADILILDRKLKVRGVWSMGHEIGGTNTLA